MPVLIASSSKPSPTMAHHHTILFSNITMLFPTLLLLIVTSDPFESRRLSKSIVQANQEGSAESGNETAKHLLRKIASKESMLRSLDTC